MFKLSHSKLIFISGLIWVFVGWMLMRLGLSLLMGESLTSSLASEQVEGSHPLLALLIPSFGINGAVLTLLVIALVIGYMKGKFVLGKSAKRGVDRILSFPEPTSIFNIYSPMYYALLGGMMFLGISIKYLGIPHDIRGMIDVAVGMALLKGGTLYFRHASAIKAQAS